MYSICADIPATNKAFKVENNRGVLAINNDGTALIGTPNVAIADVAQKNFAFVQHDGKVYLYSVWASKFVNKDCSLTNSLPVDAITVENVADGKFFFKFDNAHNVNLGGSGQIAVNDWGTKDAGNQFTLVENGDFDPTDALAILDNSCTITYNFTYNGNVVATQTTKINKGANYPAFTSLPWGAVATVPTGTADADETVDIVCTLDTSVLPFVPSATYDDANMKWYYLNIGDDAYYLYHTAGADHIALNKKAVDESAKDAYTWAFIGNPFTGYKIVNRATGNGYILSSSTNTFDGNTGGSTFPIMTAEPVGNDNNTYWEISKSANRGGNGAFYLAQKDANNGMNRMNNRGSKLAYWNGGADAGSTFKVVERPMGPVAEFEALIATAETLKTTVADNQGTAIGKYSAETLATLTAAIEAAKAIEDVNITANDVETLQAAINAVSVILPTAGKYYQFHSSLAAFAETKAVHGTDGNPGWKTLNNDDKNFYWKAVETGNGIALQNAANGKYLHGNAGQSGAWSLTDSPEGAEMGVKIFSEAENEKGFEYGIILNNWQMHANNHGGGNGAGSNLVSWNTDNANSASSWYIVEVELVEFFTVTYNFKYNGDVKYSHSVELAKGAEFPSVDAALPYGVTSNFAVPEGTVTENATFDFNLTIESELPFETAASAANITTWYYARMHTNQPGYIGDIADDKSINVAWGKSSDEYNENYVWGFVGDVFSGITVVNKGTGLQLTSTGGGNATLTENGTPFFVARTTETSANATNGFCLRRKDSNQYLNANYGAAKLSHWGSTDAGSTIFLTPVNENEVVVTEVGYATLYLGEATYIPADVEVYTINEVTAEGWAKMVQVEGVLPANTGVILKNAGEYTFTTVAKDASAIEGNLLLGSLTDTYVEGDAYVLANGVDGVGLYKAALNKNENGEEGTTHFLNNANKAYLPIVNPGVNALRFNFGGETTAIDAVEVENASAPIYDLSGRRVLSTVKGGIYIQNGKKFIVK